MYIQEEEWANMFISQDKDGTQLYDVWVLSLIYSQRVFIEVASYLFHFRAGFFVQTTSTLDFPVQSELVPAVKMKGPNVSSLTRSIGTSVLTTPYRQFTRGSSLPGGFLSVAPKGY